MIDKIDIECYLGQSKKLLLVKNNSKIALEKGWRTKEKSLEELVAHVENKGNLALNIDENTLVVDVDPRNGGNESYRTLCELIGTTWEPTVLTPTGGHHVYLSHKDPLPKIKKNLKEFPGIDFLHKGNYCLIPGSIVGGIQYLWNDDIMGLSFNPLPEKLIRLLSNDVDVEGENDDSFLDNAGGYKSPEENIVRLLHKLSPDVPNDEWIKIGMALQHWDNVRGLQLWEEWSKPGKTYKQGECAKRWKSFQNGHSITEGSLFFLAEVEEFKNKKNEIQKLIDKINCSSEKDLNFDILPIVKKTKMEIEDREACAVALQNRIKELRGVKIPIGEARGKVKEEVVRDSDAPDWCRDWVYVNSHNGFVNLKTLNVYKTEAFNLINGCHVECDTNSKPNASKFVADRGYVDHVDKMEYYPQHEYGVIEINGRKVLNAFDRRTVPLAAEKYTDEGLMAIDAIEQHIELLCGDEQNCKIFKQWLAFQVQHCGQKILWAPVIQSIQGIGKSFIGELLRAVLGHRNVGTVSSGQITSNFNGWATGVSVNVLEELRVKGHNRYDVINALKPLFTDRYIQINEKNIKPYVVSNVTNYICFTNHRDAIPVDADDRRWWVIFVNIEKLSDIETQMEIKLDAYFERLFSALNYAPEIKKWLQDYPITKEFLSLKQAPMTRYKEAMIATEETSYDGLDDLIDLIEEGGEFYNRDCISSADLFIDLTMSSEKYRDISNRAKSAMLKKLGYIAMPQTMRIGGKTRRIWAKTILTVDQVCDKLKITPSE